MSDFTAQGTHAARTPRAEFRIYFALIFVLALPVGLVTWTYRLVTTARLPALSPLHRAWADARAITPWIFRA
jgi:hypothetical protein